MATTSKPLFVYLQRPDNGEWVTVGRYQAGPATFKYAPSYVDAGLAWAIDPVNLPFRPGAERPAQRYNGLHDVLRDACPDAWGQALLRREHNLPERTHPARQWGAASGLDFASTVLHPAAEGRSAVRILRYDRIGERRLMCVSAASLLQAEYPGNLAQVNRGSYPRLAEELRIIGAPAEDRIELFGRMVFDAVCGNDDDHVRNHAVVYKHEERSWRLAPAFDVVPNPVETPRALTMQLSTGRFDISRSALLADAHRFGFENSEQAYGYLESLLTRIVNGFDQVAHWLAPEWQDTLRTRMRQNVGLLSASGAVDA